MTRPAASAAETAAIRPADIADFRVLYSQNCSGCHGANGQGALTVGIGRPVYLAIADDATIRETIEQGRPGTPMPAFAQKAGGMLTDAQIDILVHGIRSWAKPGAFANDKASGLRGLTARRCRAREPNYSRRPALRVTVRKAAARALSQTRPTWRWSAISICAR